MIGVEGDRFKIVFNFIGFPAPQICWEKDGSAFLIGEGREIINSHGRSVLKINSLALSDTGVYTCLVTSVAGTRTWVVRLKVEGKSAHEVGNNRYYACFFFLNVYMWLSLDLHSFSTTTVLSSTTAPPSTTALSPNTTQPSTTAPPSTTVLSPNTTQPPTTAPPTSKSLPNVCLLIYYNYTYIIIIHVDLLVSFPGLPQLQFLQYPKMEYCKWSRHGWPGNEATISHVLLIITYKQRVHDLVSIYPLTGQPRVSYWTIACIILATITGLMSALFCGILVAGLWVCSV